MAKVIFLLAMAALVGSAVAFPASPDTARIKRSPCQVIVGGNNSGRICSSLLDATSAAGPETAQQPAAAAPESNPAGSSSELHRTKRSPCNVVVFGNKRILCVADSAVAVPETPAQLTLAAAAAASQSSDLAVRAKRSPCQVIVGGNNSGRICSSLSDPTASSAAAFETPEQPASSTAAAATATQSASAAADAETTEQVLRAKRSPCQVIVGGDNSGRICSSLSDPASGALPETPEPASASAPLEGHVQEATDPSSELQRGKRSPCSVVVFGNMKITKCVANS